MLRDLKDLFKILIMFLIVFIVYIYRYNITNFISEKIIYRGSNEILSYNEYYLDNDFLYLQNIDVSKVNSNKELKNMLYSVINSGDENYSFYCNYNECKDDISFLIDDKNFISTLNNFVHPYNSFSYINVNLSKSGRITIKSKKLYTEQQIEYINDYIEKFVNENLKDELSTIDKIKAFHDYVINNSYYDDSNENSFSNAYNLIVDGKGICGQYSDIMSIYLNYLGIKNYKISSLNHVWNLVNIDNSWYHLDMTWDDPVTNDGKQYLIHNFFMISTKELLELDKNEHDFDLNIYLEAK